MLYFERKKCYFLCWNFFFFSLRNKSFFLSLLLQNEPQIIGPGQYACPYCPKIMAKCRDMKRHISTHTGEKAFNCPQCSYGSNRKDKLQIHIQGRHLGWADGGRTPPANISKTEQFMWKENMFFSAFSFKGFVHKIDDANFSRIYIHMHTSTILFIFGFLYLFTFSWVCLLFCWVCLSLMFQNDPIRLDDGTYACPYCPTQMQRIADMKRHITTHTGDKRFACNFCIFKTSRKYLLRNHIETRHGVR